MAATMNRERGTRRRFTKPSRRAAVLEGIIAVADASAEDPVSWHRAWCRFWISVRRAGWAPKPGAERRDTEDVG